MFIKDGFERLEEERGYNQKKTAQALATTTSQFNKIIRGGNVGRQGMKEICERMVDLLKKELD